MGRRKTGKIVHYLLHMAKRKQPLKWMFIIVMVFLMVLFPQQMSDFFPAHLPYESSGDDMAMVTQVVDGDTADVLLQGENIRLRFIGINTPERGECLYTEATNALKELILEREVRVELDDSQGELDKYQRTLAYVFREEKNAAIDILRQGLAREYTYDKPYRYIKSFKAAENEAKINNLGLWDPLGCPEQPEDSVNVILPESPDCLIKGNISSSGSRIYHLPGCGNYEDTSISQTGERWFCTEDEAEQAGWRKAGNCP